jgi:hypothetical protein
VIVLVADDPSENDGDPLRDGTTTNNPGLDRLAVRAESLGPRGAHQAIEATGGADCHWASLGRRSDALLACCAVRST